MRRLLSALLALSLVTAVRISMMIRENMPIPPHIIITATAVRGTRPVVDFSLALLLLRRREFEQLYKQA